MGNILDQISDQKKLRAMSMWKKTSSFFRFFSQIEQDPGSSCWVWTGCTNKCGYGVSTWRGRTANAHRIAYIVLTDGDVRGKVIDHLCRNRRCCNPDHLEAVSHAENTRRGIGVGAINSRKTECPKCGGQYTLYRSGARRCRSCHLATCDKWHREHREEANERRRRWHHANRDEANAKRKARNKLRIQGKED